MPTALDNLLAPTPTTNVLVPSPTIAFTLESTSATSCSSYGVSWFYNGADQPMNLYITNNNVPQDPPPSTARPPNTFTNIARAIPSGAPEPIPLLNLLITTVQNPYELGYVWPAVSVPSGWYIFNGSVPTSSYWSLSRSIYVWSSTDTSCLAVKPSTSPVGSTTSPTPTNAPQDPSPSSLPVGGSSSSTNIGTIIGISVAAVVVVAGVLAAWLCLARRKRKAKATGGEYPGAVDHRWNGLSSTDSRNILTSGGKYPSKTTKQHRSYRGAPQSRDSFGSVMMTDEGGDGMEKSGKASLDGSLALSTLPILNHHANANVQRPRGRTQSQSSAASNSYSVNDFSGGGGRRPSAPDSVVNAGRKSIDSTSYPPQSPSAGAAWAGRHAYPTSPASADVSRTHSYTTQQSQPSIRAPQLQSNPSQGSSSQSHSHQASPISPVSPSSLSTDSPMAMTSSDARAAAKQSNRQSLGGKKRKPVPAYDPSSDHSAMPSPTVPVPSSPYYYTQPQSFNTTAGTGGQSPFSPSSSPAPGSFLSESPQPPASLPQAPIGHYTTRSQAGKDQSQHSLHHKSSFGPNGIDGKPLHYLIPDMPTGP